MGTRQKEPPQKKRKYTDTFKPTHSPQIQSASTSRMQVKEGPNRSQIQQKICEETPPIIIENMTNYPQMISALSSVNIPADYYQSKVLNYSEVKINIINAEAYRAIIALLDDKGIQWLTFEVKQMRDIKVMIKDLHHSIDPTDIIQELNQKGLKAKNATNKQKWLTAEQKQDHRAKRLQEVVPLDMSIVSFDQETDIDRIYNIRAIMSSKVQIEPLRKIKCYHSVTVAKNVAILTTFATKHEVV
jgi:hypothetical protein